VHNPTPPTELINRSTSGWQFVNWRELVQYRDLLYFLTIRGIKAR
jgi:lipopolysaccharide transport system permease protein